MKYSTRAFAGRASFFAEQADCPYHSTSTGICAASLTLMIMGPVRAGRYCRSDNYDTCPLFLSKILRKAG